MPQISLRVFNELAKAMTVGTRVMRGEDWSHGDEDGHGLGTVIREVDDSGLIQVTWDNGLTNEYRMGWDNEFDLRLADPLAVLQNDSLSESMENNVFEKLSGDLAHILERKEYSDVTIKVKDREFHLHWLILTSRSPYFKSMFNSEMEEKKTGIVSIDDCDPDIFNYFIQFVYTGKVRELSEDNVCALYEVADRFQEVQLKAECLIFMTNNISEDNFFDFIALAFKREEEELLKVATALFCTKTNEIIKSSKWQNFLAEYPTQANELYIKSFELNAM